MTTMKNCRVCGNDEDWHEGHHVVHNFDPDGEQANPFGRRNAEGKRVPATPEPVVTVQAWPHDPVLRQALMDLGVITPGDLRQAEEKIRAITIAVTGG